MQPKWYFDKFARPYLRNKEVLNTKELKQIDDFVNRLVPSAMKRKRFQGQDPKWVFNSFYDGMIAEIAIENFTGTKFISWEIRKEEDLDKSDLFYYGLNIGVKTAKFGNLPLVYKSHRIETPEIITIVDLPNTVYVIGYATKPMLKYYQSSEYGYGNVMEYKGGYWGFHKLYDFKTMDDLKDLYANKEINVYNNFTDTVKDYPIQEGILTF